MVEGIAAEAIKPGHVIEHTADDKFQKQSTAKKDTLLRIATENDLIGKTIDDAYAADDNCYMHIPKSGDKCMLRLPAGAAALVIGDLLELSGDGTVRKLTDGKAVAEVELAVDNSAGPADAFVQARIL